MLCTLKKYNILKKSYCTKIQYVSDVHVDHKDFMPYVEPMAEYLAICGDIGIATHPNVNKFIEINSKKFKKVFIVAGNHEYRCSAIYNKKKVMLYKPLLIDMCNSYDNVYFLDKSCHQLSDNILIVGTTLWSHSEYILNEVNRLNHNNEHDEHVTFIKDICAKNQKQKIVMLTHYVPSFKLIEPKYSKYGKLNTLFATDLEYLIQKPIEAWICGHTHSILDMKINNIYCGINALGHDNVDCLSKIICIKDNE